jgi:predicted nucleic acid-binding Zn ribbon protein
MPTYVYKNLETGEIYEFKQSMRDEAYTRHPETEEPIKRVLSRPGIAFRGSGFYVNDSRRESGDAAKAAGQGSAATSGAADRQSSSGGSGGE